VRIFSRKSRTRRTLCRHQIWVFRCRSEQLVGQEGRRELKLALVHILGAEASPEATLTIDKHRPSHLTVAGLRCRSPSIKVSINTFPSSPWARADTAPDRSQLPQPLDRHQVTLASAVKSRWQHSVRLDLNTRVEIPIRLVQSEPSIQKLTTGV
jgi:hypothetical protein